MSRFEAWMLHMSMILVGGTGLIYGWMRYFVESTDPFSVVNHPWQPALQHVHIWVAPLLVFAAGLVWTHHIWAHFRRGIEHGRRSGLLLLLNLTPMVLSGYLIQTAVAPGWRTAWVVIHLVASGLWTLGYSAHLYAFWFRRRAAGLKTAARRAALGSVPGRSELGERKLISAVER